MPTITSSLKRSLVLSALVCGSVVPLTAPTTASVTLRDFDAAITTDTRTADDHYDRGVYHQGQNQLEAAIAQFTQAIAINPNNPDYYFGRGLTYSDLGDLKSAQSDFSTAIELDNSFAAAYYQRGLSRIVIPVAGVNQLSRPNLSIEQRDKVQLAIQDFSQALQHLPGFVAAHYYRGLSHYVMGNESLAWQDYQQARQLNPLIAESFYRQGFTQLYNGGPKVKRFQDSSR